jgi:hypothetical protein
MHKYYHNHFSAESKTTMQEPVDDEGLLYLHCRPSIKIWFLFVGSACILFHLRIESVIPEKHVSFFSESVYWLKCILRR